MYDEDEDDDDEEEVERGAEQNGVEGGNN